MFPFIIILVAVPVIWWLLSQRAQSLAEPETLESVVAEEIPGTAEPDCVPTFVDGGGPYYQPNAPIRSKLAPDSHVGEILRVSGRVLAADCVTPLQNVIVDIWQANESGNYDDVWYRGQVQTDADGTYEFETVVPKGYGAGTAYRPPHIHFKIWQAGRELITSQMFLPASRAQGIAEAYIMKIETSEMQGVTEHRGTHNIVVP